jgi:hypothetical protein
MNETLTEYLTDIKFRNAVKRATKLRVFNKSDFGYRYGVRIASVTPYGFPGVDTFFTVRWLGGSSNHENVIANAKEEQAKLTADLLKAGFEPVEIMVRRPFSTTELESIIAYRKAVA